MSAQSSTIFQHNRDYCTVLCDEQWLENIHKIPVASEIWAKTLWEDPRIRAAAQAADASVRERISRRRFMKLPGMQPQEVCTQGVGERF